MSHSSPERRTVTLSQSHPSKFCCDFSRCKGDRRCGPYSLTCPTVTSDFKLFLLEFDTYVFFSQLSFSPTDIERNIKIWLRVWCWSAATTWTSWRMDVPVAAVMMRFRTNLRVLTSAASLQLLMASSCWCWPNWLGNGGKVRRTPPSGDWLNDTVAWLHLSWTLNILPPTPATWTDC